MNIEHILKLNKGKLSVDQLDELIREYINKRIEYGINDYTYLKTLKWLRNEAQTHHQKLIIKTAISVERDPNCILRRLQRSKSVGDEPNSPRVQKLRKSKSFIKS